MRRYLRTAVAEIALVAASFFMEWLLGDFPGWIWGIVAAVGIAILVFMNWRDAKRAKVVIVKKVRVITASVTASSGRPAANVTGRAVAKEECRTKNRDV